MSQLHNIEDKARYENAFFAIGRCAETFYLFAPNIPKNLCEITQHIHGRFDEALYYVFRASNSYDIEEKIFCLEKAHESLFFQQTSLYLLVKSHGATIGQANTVIDCIKGAYDQINKWKNALIKTMKKSVAEV